MQILFDKNKFVPTKSCLYEPFAIAYFLQYCSCLGGRAVTKCFMEREVRLGSKFRAGQIGQSCQRLATAATFLRKDLGFLKAQ